MLRLLVEPIVRAALAEDLGRAGDITAEAIVAEDAKVTAMMAARQPGVLAGLDAGLLAFELLDPNLRLERLCAEGSRVERGQAVARITGRGRSALAAVPQPARWSMRSRATRPRSSAPARRRRACASSKKRRCGSAAAPITASAS